MQPKHPSTYVGMQQGIPYVCVLHNNAKKAEQRTTQNGHQQAAYTLNCMLGCSQ
jgi:hypothetical protein